MLHFEVVLRKENNSYMFLWNIHLLPWHVWTGAFESHWTAFLCKADTTFSKSKAAFTTMTLTNDLSDSSVQESVFESRLSLVISSTAGLICVGSVHELCLS